MEYILTNKGLMNSIILPIVMQVVILIEWKKIVSVIVRKIITFIYYLIGTITFIFFLFLELEPYFYYVWALTLMASYPILNFFSKKGDKFLDDLSEEERIQYRNVTKNMVSVIGILIIIGTVGNVFLNIVDFDLDGKMETISIVLYLVLGAMCLGYAKSNKKIVSDTNGKYL